MPALAAFYCLSIKFTLSRRFTLLTFALLSLPTLSTAQNVLSTIKAGNNPYAVAVNLVTNTVYVANYSSGNVTVIDGTTDATATVTVGTAPVAVAVNPATNTTYVANYGSANVTVIDGATNATTTVKTGTFPYAVAVNALTNKIYVANAGSGNVTVIDGESNATTTVKAGTEPYAVAVNPVTNKVYVANNGSGNVTVIDGKTNAAATVKAGTNPDAIAVNDITDTIYVANSGSSNVTVIDGETNATATVTAGTTPNALAVNPVTNTVYAANKGSKNVTVIDGAKNTATTIAAGTNPYAVALNTLTNTIYVSNSGGKNVTVIAGATGKTTTVNAGTGPQALAVNPATNRIYVANNGGNSVTVIDGATVVVTTISPGVFTYPQSVDVNPATNKIYVADNAGGLTGDGGTPGVTEIDGATNEITQLSVGPYPLSVKVNPITNKIYVLSLSVGTSTRDLTVIDGSTSQATQVDVGVVPVVGSVLEPLAVNPVTNMIYVANQGNNSVTIIDGSTNETASVPTVDGAYALAVNPATNKIYVPAGYGPSPSSVTVIDGATHATETIKTVDSRPAMAVAVNSVTNKIYISEYDGALTVIDGATNGTTSVPVGGTIPAIAVNPVTNKIYLTNDAGNSVTVIDGATNGRTAVPVGAGPVAIAVNPATNTIYVVNCGPLDPGTGYCESAGSSVTVIDGATNKTTTEAEGSLPVAVSVNHATGAAYVANNDAAGYGGGNVTVIAPTGSQTIPLKAKTEGVKDSQTIGGLAIWATTNSNPSFTTTVTSSFSPTSPAPTALYYQLDTAQGAWATATATTAPGANPATYDFKLSAVPWGVHTLFVFPAYGDEGSPANSGQGTGNSPVIGGLNPFVFGVVQIPTETVITSNPNPQNGGSDVTFAGAVTSAGSARIPTGSLTFLNQSTQLAQVSLDATGKASYTTSDLKPGKHTIVAVYSGDSLSVPSHRSLVESIAGKPVIITAVSGSGQSAVVGQAFSNPLVVAITDAGGLPVPNAAVTFSGGNVSFAKGGKATTNESGEASMTVKPTASGPLLVEASVNGVSSAALFSLTGTP
jgi:YVTN family beta-propeller protein